jgi:hypothetical protein
MSYCLVSPGIAVSTLTYIDRHRTKLLEVFTLLVFHGNRILMMVCLRCCRAARCCVRQTSSTHQALLTICV